MRNTLAAIALTAAAALSSPALAQSTLDPGSDPSLNYAAPVIGGAVIGTVAGVGLYNGWWGSSATATSLGATAASSAVAGGVIGVGSIALIDAATQPCRGFSAMFNLRPNECVNGQYVGYRETRMRRVR